MWPIKSSVVKFRKSRFNISYVYFIHTTNSSTCSFWRRFRHGRKLSCYCQGRNRRLTKSLKLQGLENCQALLIYLLQFRPCIMCPRCSAAWYDVCRWGKNQFTDCKSRGLEQLHVYSIKKSWHDIYCLQIYVKLWLWENKHEVDFVCSFDQCLWVNVIIIYFVYILR